ncbi:MAG: hypothetical protein KKB78_15640, partial [Alphaproteobacteria bacterium]|nr:hypothetical protein [Alphaproteobacteria bacterium]
MPLEWAVKRSTAKWVLPVLVGPRTALTGWEEDDVIILEPKLTWRRAPRNRRSSNGGADTDFSGRRHHFIGQRHAFDSLIDTDHMP